MKDILQVGEYCRTAGGRIFKVSEVETFSGCNYIPKDENKTLVVSAIVKHSFNLINIIEDGDFCKIEFYSPRYEERVIRIFEVSKIDEYIIFENFHCDLFMANGEWSCHDKRLNPVIKSIVTKEQFESVSYKVKE